MSDNTRPAETADFVRMGLNLNWRNASWRYEQAMRISDSELDTAVLAHHALNWPAIPGRDHPYIWVWEAVSYDAESAQAFYATITDESELRSLAVEALFAAGWTLDLIEGY